MKADTLDGTCDRQGIRIPAEALISALLERETRAQRRLGEIDRADFVTRAICRWVDAFNIGERSLDGFKHAATSAVRQVDPPTIVGR